jgi:hypothetical protein
MINNMQSIRVKRLELLGKIKANRDNHRDLFLKAQEGFRVMAIEELDKMLKEARDGKPIRSSMSLVHPQDHTDDYDRVISMLEMSVDEIIEIDSHQFDQFIRDNWQWKAFANQTNELYAARAIK